MKRGIAIPEPGNNFMPAENKDPIYVVKGVSVCDISAYITKKTNIVAKIEKNYM